MKIDPHDWNPQAKKGFIDAHIDIMIRNLKRRINKLERIRLYANSVKNKQRIKMTERR